MPTKGQGQGSETRLSGHDVWQMETNVQLRDLFLEKEKMGFSRLANTD